MSYQRDRLSGAQYRKIAKGKSEKEKEIVASTRKIDNFFTKNVATDTILAKDISSTGKYMSQTNKQYSTQRAEEERISARKCRTAFLGARMMKNDVSR